MKIVPGRPTDYKSAFILAMASRLIGDMPLPEQMLAQMRSAIWRLLTTMS